MLHFGEKEMKTITIILIGMLFSISFISAMNIDFYYSPQCPHCQNVIPTINLLMKQYNQPCYIWNVFDTSQTSYNIPGVPFIKIKTSDNRNIEISGDTPILNQLLCELQQMSTKECPTYSNGEGTRGGSWFIE